MISLLIASPADEARSRWACYLDEQGVDPTEPGRLDRAEMLEYIANAWPEAGMTQAQVRQAFIVEGQGKETEPDLFGDPSPTGFWTADAIDAFMAQHLRRRNGGDQLALFA